jgi:hypothetical protein
MTKLRMLRLWWIDHLIRNLRIHLEYERITTGAEIQRLEEKRAKIEKSDDA